MRNEEIESCIQTLRFLENNFIYDHGMFLNDKYPDNIEKIIKFLIDKRWIPVSERLPKENDTYEVTLRGISELEGITEIAYATWLNNDWLYHDVDDWQYKEVIAWKTRTQPYKAESED